MRVRNAAIASAMVIGAMVTTSPRATAADTTTTFTVTATTGLTISAPGSANLSSAAPGGTASGSLGNVTVNDQRSQLSTTWTATVELTTVFTTGSGSASETISGAQVTYTPGNPITETNPPHTPGTAGTLAAQRTAYSRGTGDGANSVTWNPSVSVDVPASNVSGTYTGVITHSVS
ncbi:hypothetical protein PYK79_37760 [Streptomyces sp. ID05-04B]|uniref:hypothetical protein n=1 Tax=unclassified Streptomyces TaxID=2593676 RepID=UPI000D1A1724|nr:MULTISPECIES: hypothetical protein [unclassified Streptomyces]AVV44731.1 hypothetical protein C6376_28220 [Streptomyces sp. P3]MDX5567855.1 hypothetical protein [Streptomyces sp. ID05-04B]